MNQGNKANVNKKQIQTKESVSKESGEVSAKDNINRNIRSYITHNKGGKWELIKAPTVGSDGKKIACYLDEDCSLHLQIYSSEGMFAPPYSQNSAIGIVVAVGNVGQRLEPMLADRMSTYLSRDGGLNWNEVKKGAYIYELGDHGGLIVMTKHNTPTQEIIYSFNEGKTWHEIQISQTPISISNIIIEPFSISQEFVVYGQVVTPSSEEGKPPTIQGVVITMDFKGLHEPQCKGADKPGESDSDFELWTPYDGRHGDNKCFMGQQISYTRRKQDSECFNGEELERKVVRSYCACTEMDFECDIGYEKSDLGSCNKIAEYDTKVASMIKEDQAAQCETYGFYSQSQGYRKVPGNRCMGGLDLGPVNTSCSAVQGLLSLRSFFTIVVLGLILYYGWPVFEAIIILLPIPDPKDLVAKFTGLFASKAKPTTKGKGYMGGFGQAPETLGESDEEAEDDIGKAPTVKQRKAHKKAGLSYGDSDDDEEKDGA